jgi:signal transduction histidine kinase
VFSLRLDQRHPRPAGIWLGERIDLKALVADIVADAQWEARERECRVEFVGNGDCTIEANPDLLRSAAENVIRNAVHYTAAGTAVEVRVECRHRNGGDAATIWVSDRGPGVPDAELSNISVRSIGWPTRATASLEE